MKYHFLLHRHHVLKTCLWLSRSRALARSISTSTGVERFSPTKESRDTSTLFNYTSGRWVYNEDQRLRESKRVFNVIEMQRLAAEAVSRKYEDVLYIDKLGEGAANRAFIIEFKDGFRLVARIPYPVTQPRQLVVASEAATMAFLRSKGIPVPEIYSYSASADNPAETEYIFMEFSTGRELSTVWFDMNEHDRFRLVTSLVELEARLFDIRLPASGSLYFSVDLPATVERLEIDGSSTESRSVCIGPSTSLGFWYGRRSGLNTDRGPYTDVEGVLKAGAEKESHYLKLYGRPLLPFDRMRRELFHLEKQLPSVHLDSLQKYLQIAKDLVPRGNNNLGRPIIRHPDLRPSNIFVSDDYQITSLIDWQYSTVLPLFLHSGVPSFLDNSMDAVSRAMDEPQLPENLRDLSEDERLQQLDLFHKRQLYYFYMTKTANKNPTHFEALTHPFSIGRRKVYQLSGSPWQGDNIPLRSSLIFIKEQWHQIATRTNVPCPITFTEDEARECLRLDNLAQEVEEQLEASKEMLGLGPEGWVSCDRYETAKEAIARMKIMCLDQAESEFESTVIKDHWVYDDMDEDEYL